LNFFTTKEIEMPKIDTTGTDALAPLGYKTLGGHQPPGSGNQARNLIDSELGWSAASTFAGEQTMLNALGALVVRLWDEESKKTTVYAHEPDLRDRLEKGNDWVRVNLTANELLSDVKLESTSRTGAASATVKVSLGSVPPITITEPDSSSLKTAVAEVAKLQASNAKNRDEIVAQANDAGLLIARAMTLDVVRHRHFLYLFDTLELVLALPLYEAKLHLDVPRPSDPVFGSSILSVVPVPKHQSFPSGHASYAWAIVELVIGIVPLRQAQQDYLRSLAARIAHNREVAGLHTALDSAAGHLLGESLGKWMAEAAKDSAHYPKWATLVAQAQDGWRLRANEM
jgi:hypothetical protein